MGLPELYPTSSGTSFLRSLIPEVRSEVTPPVEKAPPGEANEGVSGHDPQKTDCPGTRKVGSVGPSVGLGFTISKKVGNAVQRNRVRRRLREALQQILPQDAQENTDYVLIGRTEALTRSFSDILDDVRVSLKRIRDIEPGTSSPPPPTKGWRKKKKKRRKSSGKKLQNG